MKIVTILSDCRDVLPNLRNVNVIIADPPYFLSQGGGTTCRSGRRASVAKGSWDAASNDPTMRAREIYDWAVEWLDLARKALHDDGTLWCCGTYHNIHTIAYVMQWTGWRILNEIVWEKPNPPPNLGCRHLTQSNETILWAAKSHKSRYHFDYPASREIGNAKQLKTVWRMPTVSTGRIHATQKPVELANRMIRISCPPGGVVVDPMMGSGTTLAAAHANRVPGLVIGIEKGTDEYLHACARLEQEGAEIQPGTKLLETWADPTV